MDTVDKIKKLEEQYAKLYAKHIAPLKKKHKKLTGSDMIVPQYHFRGRRGKLGCLDFSSSQYGEKTVYYACGTVTPYRLNKPEETIWGHPDTRNIMPLTERNSKAYGRYVKTLKR